MTDNSDIVNDDEIASKPLDRQPVSDRRLLFRKLVRLTALGAVSSLLLGAETRKARAICSGVCTPGDVLFDDGDGGDAEDDHFSWDVTNHRLGIGGMYPANTLEVRGDASITGLDPRLGIGTTNPQRKLHVYGSGPRVLIEDWTGGNSEVNFKTQNDTTTDIWALYKKASTGDLRFYQGIDKVTIQNGTGNVGINTTNPQWKLDVAGDARFEANNPGGLIVNVTNDGIGSQTCGLAASIESITSLLRMAAVQGDADQGDGVSGDSNSGSGVMGSSQSGDGVYGSSNSGFGVRGKAIGMSQGVVGITENLSNPTYLAIGVQGAGSTGTGVLGSSNTGTGVLGGSVSGRCVHAWAFGSDAKPLVAQGYLFGQTANLQEWQDPLGNALSVVDKNGSLGIGIANPQFNIHAVGTTDPASITVDGIGIVGPNFMFRRARGTTTTPTAVQQNDGLLYLVAKGYGSTDFSSSGRANISMYAAQDWTDAAQGTYMTFKTTQSGTTNQTEKMRITDTGTVVPPSDGAGSIGVNGQRWGLVRAVTITPGDLVFENGVRATEEGDGIALYSKTNSKIAVFDQEGNLHIKGDVIRDL